MQTREEPRALLANKAFTVMGYDNGGFVIVSNDDLLPDIIGYSSSTFDKQTNNDGLKWYLAAAGRSYQWRGKVEASRIAMILTKVSMKLKSLH